MSPWSRIQEAKRDGTPVVNVDGSYVYQKYISLTEAGENIAQPGLPPPPLTEWKLVSETTCKDIAIHIPLVTSGEFKNSVMCLFKHIVPCFIRRFGVYLPCQTHGLFW